jgi:hypothetical protein
MVALLVCAGSFAMGAAKGTGSAVGDARAQFAGTYKYAGETQEDDARKAVIEQAVQSMSAFTRSTARSRILATTQIPGTYAFSFEPGKIRVLPESRPEMISGDKGEPAEYVYNGKKSTLTQTLEGNRLTQVFVSGDGKRQNEFALSADGQTLTLKVTLTISRLSSPIVYGLSYKKAG